MRKKWTTSEVRKLEEMYVSGCGFDEMSIALDRTKSSIHSGLGRHGINSDVDNQVNRQNSMMEREMGGLGA